MIGAGRRNRVALALFAAAVFWVGPVLGDETAPDDKYARIREARRLTKVALGSMQAGQYDSALVNLDSVLAADSTNADAWYYRGLAQAKSGDTATALESLAQGAARAPLSTRIKLLLARLNLIAGNPAAAETALDQILAIKPNEGEAHYLKGLAQLQQSDTTAALESFEHALKTVYPSAGNE